MTVMTVQVDIGAALKDGFATAFGQATVTAVKLDNAISAVDTRITTMKGWAAAKKETAAAKEEWQRATAKAKAMADQLAATATPTQALKDKVAAARQEADRAKAAFMGTATGLKAMDTQMKAAGVSIRTVKAELDAAGRSMAALERRRESLNKVMAAKAANAEARTALKGQIVETVALGTALALPIQRAVAFESAMADVRKVVDGLDTPEAFAVMSRDIQSLATDKGIPMAAAGIADIVAAAGQAGIAREELVRFAEDAAKMGVAFDMSGAEAGGAMTGLRSIFHLTQDQVVSLGDAYNHLSNNMDATARDMLSVANRAGSTAVQFGLTGQQLGALSGTFLALKTPPEVAGTAINSILMKLSTGDKQGQKFQAALSDIGLSAQGLKDAIKNDAQRALVDFLDAVKQADDMKGVLFDLFGQEYQDDVIKLVGGLDQYKKALKLAGDAQGYAGSMGREFSSRSATTANNLQLLGNRVDRLAVNLGTVLLPAVNDVVSVVGGFTDTLAVASQRFPLVTKAVVYTTAAFVAYKVAKLGIGLAWTTVKGVMLDTRLAFTKTATAATIATVRMRGFSVAGMVSGFRGAATAALAFAGRPLTAVLVGLRAVKLAVMTNPIGLIATGLLTVAELVITNWDKIYKVIRPAVEWIVKVFDAIPVVGTAIKTVRDWLSDDDATTDGGAGTDGDLGAVNDNAANDNASAPIFERKTAKGGGGGAGGGGPTYQINGPITIHVHSQPGQDPAAIAGETKKALEGATKGGNLYDE